jgi:hypothetical protein
VEKKVQHNPKQRRKRKLLIQINQSLFDDDDKHNYLTRRAHTAYTLYIMDILPKLKAAHPNKIQKELITMAASQWSQLDEESKKVSPVPFSLY